MIVNNLKKKIINKNELNKLNKYTKKKWLYDFWMAPPNKDIDK